MTLKPSVIAPCPKECVRNGERVVEFTLTAPASWGQRYHLVVPGPGAIAVLACHTIGGEYLSSNCDVLDTTVELDNLVFRTGRIAACTVRIRPGAKKAARQQFLRDLRRSVCVYVPPRGHAALIRRGALDLFNAEQKSGVIVYTITPQPGSGLLITPSELVRYRSQLDGGTIESEPDSGDSALLSKITITGGLASLVTRNLAQVCGVVCLQRM